MPKPYLGEVRIFAFPFAPSGWAICQGQLLQVDQNQELFRLLGYRYGGDGSKTFALPDLQGRVPRHKSASDTCGKKYGAESLVLTEDSLPAHTHELLASHDTPTTHLPSQNVLAAATIYADPKHTTTMSAKALAPSAGKPHNNMQPSLVLNYCIALQGTYPPQA